MKIIMILLTCFFFMLSVTLNAQQMKKLEDAYIIKKNEKMFIGKPLSELLKEIKPSIKSANGNPSVNFNSEPGYFRFTFFEPQEKAKFKSKGKLPITIVVYVKENFDWNFKTRPKGKELVWTKEDEKKFGNLTIAAIRIYGQASHN